MQEKEIKIPAIDIAEFFGTNNQKFSLVKKSFPKLKIIARGDSIKVQGDPEIIEVFEEKLNALFWYIEKYNKLEKKDIENIIESDTDDIIKNSKFDENVLVYGPNGHTVKARTKNQARMVEDSRKNDMVFALGPAGTGKSYTAVALAVQALKKKEVRRIIMTRPAVEAGENLGFLPGDLKEKLDPYMMPLYDALSDMIHAEKLEGYLEKGIIEIAPLAFMRGRTLDKAYVILDEAQNATVSQMKMFLTRMGEHAKFIITGDMSQVDLPKHQKSGLRKVVDILEGTHGISFIHLDGSDVIRHPLVKKIITAFEKDDIKTEAENEARKNKRSKRD